MDRYYDEMVEGTPAQVETETQLARLAEFFGQTTMLHEVGSDRISQFVAWRKVQKARRKGTRVSPSTVNRDVELLRRVINRAHETWERQINDRIKWRDLLLLEPEGRTRELSATEEQDLVRVIESMRPELLAPFLFSMMTGLRQAAVVNLRWSQVDLARNVVTIRLKSRTPGGRIHTVPLSRAARTLIDQQAGKHETAVFTYVCRLKRGERAKESVQPITSSWVGNLWRAALRTAQVADFRWHDLRHTAATRLLRVSHLKAVQMLLGHKDISSTARYAHTDVEDVRWAVEAMGTRMAESHQNHTSPGQEEPIPLKKKA
jgi:integrase